LPRSLISPARNFALSRGSSGDAIACYPALSGTPLRGGVSHGQEVAVLDARERVAELYKTYGPAIYRRCLRLLGDKEAARDATQEVFGKLMRDARKLESRDTALPWIYRVATNHCLNLRRNAGRRGEEPLPELEIAVSDTPDTVPDRQLVQRVLARFDSEAQAGAVGG